MNSLNQNDARLIVRAVFEEMGIDMSTPEARDKARKDFMFMREVRETSERAKNWIMNTVIVSFVSGILALIVLGFQNWTGK